VSLRPSESDRERALALTPVSRETLRRLDAFVDLLLRWQQTTNLIAASTVPQLWIRHVADSLQLLDLAPDALVWVDMGTGGGFPGLVIACALADRPGAQVHLVESNAKKAAFLREAVNLTRVPATVHALRMEKFVESSPSRVDVVTARAVSPLALLLDACEPLLRCGAVGLFPKGQDVEVELTEASKYWSIGREDGRKRPLAADLVPSRTDPKGRIVRVKTLEQKQKVR
jgi:16S rRNA (guanine527-N7)-methyltransferase